MEYLPLLYVLLATVIIKYACDLFEQSASYLGRNMAPGIKGATVNAIGSSMPEMMSCFAILFFFNDPALFAVALGITAGSAVFNTAVIPALCIIIAPVKEFAIEQKSLMRDVFWVVLSDIALITMIMNGRIDLMWGILLNVIYFGYALHLWIDSKRGEVEEDDEYEDEELPDRGTVLNVLTFNWNSVLFKDSAITLRSALVLLAIATVGITAGSHILVEGVIGSAGLLGVPYFISGLILGAAASSVPDLILSVKDAKNGDYEDAVANPLASNTFDTTISIALPLVLWMLVYGHDAILLNQDNLDALRISVVLMSLVIGIGLILRSAKITKTVGWAILALYASWTTWVIMSFT